MKLDQFGHGRLFGFESAKAGLPRRCPYRAEKTEAIRGWLHGYDEYKSLTRQHGPHELESRA